MTAPPGDHGSRSSGRGEGTGRGGGAGGGAGGGGGTGRRGGTGRENSRRPPRPGTDPARRAAFDVLRAVAVSDAYANLVLPPMLADRGIRGRDAAFATELAYGTLRLRGRYDAILARTSSRPLGEVDDAVLDLLRLGAHQLLGMRVPPHAAVAETVALARSTVGSGRAQFVNAVLRAVAARGLDVWLDELRAGPDALATEYSHPGWVVRALREALVAGGRPVGEITDLLAADNAAAPVTLVARPGLISLADLATQARDAGLEVAGPGRYVSTALRLAAGDPSRVPAVRDGRAGVQDEGSQLVALAAAAAARGAWGPADLRATTSDRRESAAGSGAAPTGPASPPRWLDLCAGPGGKAALLGAVLAQRSNGHGVLVANEVAPHRARLVRDAVRALRPAATVAVQVGDGRDVGRTEPGAYDLVLLDAPCTGLGALRRRPEARWRRRPEDLSTLTALQRDLLRSAVAAAAPGGVVAYVTCSPHVAETRAVVEDAVAGHRLEVLDAGAAVRAVAEGPAADLGDGPFVQLWPHRHGVDAMFLALLRRPG